MERMGSRDDQMKPRQPLLSSLVVRPADSGGGCGGSGAADYEPGEVRPDAPPNSRLDRYSDDLHGYRKRALSGSPTHRRDVDRQLSTDFDHPGDLHHGRGFGGGRAAMRSPGRYRDYSPSFARDNGSSRPFGKSLDGPGMGFRRFRGEGSNRNNPNVRPREGDWYCPDPRCRNLNFARRDYCNSCSLHRDAPIRSPRRGYRGAPAPQASPRRHAPMRSPTRGYGGPQVSPRRHAPMRSPTRGYGGPQVSPRRHAPMGSPRRGYGGPPAPMVSLRRHPGSPVGRFPGRFYTSPPRGFASRDLGLGGPPRRLVSPPTLGAHRGRWTNRDVRQRSRSPLRGSGVLQPAPLAKDFRYLGAGRDRIGSYY